MSARDEILDNIVTTLSAITGIAEVTKARVQSASWGANERWAKVALFTDSETATPRMGCNIWDYFWTVGVAVFYKGENAQQEIHDLMQPIREAMLNGASLTRGGHAWNTHYTGSAPIEDTFADDRNAAAIVMNFQVHYRENY